MTEVVFRNETQKKGTFLYVTIARAMRIPVREVRPALVLGTYAEEISFQLTMNFGVTFGGVVALKPDDTVFSAVMRLCPELQLASTSSARGQTPPIIFPTGGRRSKRSR